MPTVTHVPQSELCEFCLIEDPAEPLVTTIYELFEARLAPSRFHERCSVSGPWAARFALIEEGFGLMPLSGSRKEGLQRVAIGMREATEYGVDLFVSDCGDTVAMAHVYPWLLEKAIRDLVDFNEDISFRVLFDTPWNWGAETTHTLIIGKSAGNSLARVRMFLDERQSCSGCGMAHSNARRIDYSFAGHGSVCSDECHSRVREWVWLDVAGKWGLSPRISGGFCIHLLGQSWDDFMVDQHLRACKLQGIAVGASQDHARHWRVQPGSVLEPMVGAGSMVTTSEPHWDKAEIDPAMLRQFDVPIQVIRHDSLPIHNPSPTGTVLFLWLPDPEPVKPSPTLESRENQ